MTDCRMNHRSNSWKQDEYIVIIDTGRSDIMRRRASDKAEDAERFLGLERRQQMIRCTAI
jgi:adenylate kinase